MPHAQVPREHFASSYTVAVRTTTEDTVYPEVTIERRSYIPGTDVWAIVWGRDVWHRERGWVHDGSAHPDREETDAERAPRRYTLDEAFSEAPRAVAGARAKRIGDGRDLVCLLTPSNAEIGQTMAEYVIVLSIITIAILTTLIAIGDGAGHLIEKTLSAIGWG
jgi:hypothetical protein